MMQLKNILLLAKRAELKVSEYVEKKISIKLDSVKSELDIKTKSFECELETLRNKNESISEENELLKKSCVNLSRDIQLIAQAISQIYLLTEKAISPEIEEDFLEEDFLSINNKKKKKEYH